MPGHTHTIDAREFTGSGNIEAGYPTKEQGSTNYGPATITSNSKGAGEAHNNMPPYLALNYIIKH